MLGLCYCQSNAKTNVLKFKKSKLAHSLPAYNAIMLYYITFYYTLSPIVIVSHLKVPSLQILHTEHYRVNLCRSETISFLVITFPALENKCSLATDVAGILPAAGQWILAVRKCQLGEVSCQLLLTHDLSRRGVVCGRRRRYSIAGLRGVQFVPQARRRCGVACRC